MVGPPPQLRTDDVGPYAGVHLLAELWHPASPVTDPAVLEGLMVEASRRAGCEVMCVRTQAFSPEGITGFAILAESHLSVHTWPELDYVAVDVFTCGTSTDPEAALAFLVEALRPERVERREVRRGRVLITP